MKAAALHDRASPADGGHLTLVSEAKWLPRRALEVGEDGIGDVAALLQSNRRHSGQRPFRALRTKVRLIAHDEDLAAARDAEVLSHHDAALRVAARPEIAPEARSLHSRRPQHRRRAEVLLADVD